jgi:ketosteroid isomerase-like protein
MGNADVVASAYEAFGRGDIPALVDLLDDRVEWSSPMTLPQGGQYKGKDGVVRFFESVGAAWATLSLTVESTGEITDDLVVAVVDLTGELRDGGPATYGSMHAFTVRGGKIVQFREYTDLDKPLTSR